MLKVQRSEVNGLVILSISGRIDEVHVPELQTVLNAEAEGVEIVLDLEEVRLVDRAAVKFLAACEAQGIKLNSCPSYIREWIEQGAI